MFASGLETRKYLRVFLLTAVVITSSVGLARATDVDLSHNGTNNSGNITGASSLGYYQFKVVGPQLGTWALNDIIQTYCISQNNFLSGNTFELRNDLHNLPTPGSSMGALNAVRLVILINELYGNGADATINGYQTGTNNLLNIQNSIWTMLAGGSDTLIAAVDSVLAASGGTLLGYLSTHNTSSFVAARGLNQYGSGQDQIYWTPGPGTFIFDVPVPGGAILAGVGIFCVGGINFLRRRKAKLA